MEELIIALVDRLQRGEDKVSLQREVLSLGHTKAVFERAYAEAHRRVFGTSDTTPTTEMTTRAHGDLHTLEIRRPSNPTLMGYRELLHEGWQIGNESAGMVRGLMGALALFFAVVVGVLLLLSVAFDMGTFTHPVGAVVGLVMVVIGYISAIVYFTMVGLAFVRGVLERHEGVVFWPHFWWTWRRIIPFFILSFYIQIIVQAGFVLFIIPGLVASLYLGYAVLVLLADDRRGFDALIHSVELIYGRFWPIVLRKLFLVAVFGALVAAGLLMIMLQPLIALLVGLVVVLGGYFIFCASIALFESVQSLPPVHVFTQQERKTIKTWLLVFVVAALTFVVFSSLGMVRGLDPTKTHPVADRFMAHMNDAMHSENESKSVSKEPLSAVNQEVIDRLEDVANSAQRYFVAHNDSYAGVCSDEANVNPLLQQAYDIGSSDVFCHDDHEWYIAEAKLIDRDTHYCVDSSGNRLMQKYSRNGYQTCLDWLSE